MTKRPTPTYTVKLTETEIKILYRTLDSGFPSNQTQRIILARIWLKLSKLIHAIRTHDIRRTPEYLLYKWFM